MKKYSKQRELILNSLKSRMDHPTAETLYSDLKQKMPNIGVATVYRNLIDLCEDGSIIKIKSKNGPDRYDGNINPHIHFECEECRNVYDIYLDNKEEIYDNIKKLAKSINAEPDSISITISGRCQECSK